MTYFRAKLVILSNSFFGVQEWKKKKKNTSPKILWAGLLLVLLSHPRILMAQPLTKQQQVAITDGGHQALARWKGKTDVVLYLMQFSVLQGDQLTWKENNNKSKVIQISPIPVSKEGGAFCWLGLVIGKVAIHIRFGCYVLFFCCCLWCYTYRDWPLDWNIMVQQGPVTFDYIKHCEEVWKGK